MNALEKLSRVALGWVFIHAGSDVLRKPAPPAQRAAPVLSAVRSVAPVDLPDDVVLVRLNAATQVAAGAALSLGWAPRAAAVVLIGSLIPTTAGGHRFWEFEDVEARAGQRNHFIKNISIVGGLLHVVATPRTGRTAHESGRDQPGQRGPSDRFPQRDRAHHGLGRRHRER
jgi:putative oxidoreductase